MASWVYYLALGAAHTISTSRLTSLFFSIRFVSFLFFSFAHRNTNTTSFFIARLLCQMFDFVIQSMERLSFHAISLFSTHFSVALPSTPFFQRVRSTLKIDYLSNLTRDWWHCVFSIGDMKTNYTMNFKWN